MMLAIRPRLTALHRYHTEDFFAGDQGDEQGRGDGVFAGVGGLGR